MQTFDLKDNTVRELNQALHEESSSGADVRVINPGGKHSVAVGAMYPGTVTIEGHVGYYCAGMNQNAEITVRGNAGSGCAENMMSGKVRVTGNASQYCGATAHGGLLVVEGDTSSRCGISMKGVDIVVGGSVGNMSAFMAQSGRLVVCGDAGDALGDSLYEARIYVAGEVRSLGADCIEKEMRDEHREELAALLEAAGIDADPARFRRYGSARKLYNFSIDHAGEY
jgi:glutamate synthase domain-containing protein 3